MLNILLNYLHYVNMVKMEVLDKANGAISKYNNILCLKNELQEKNEMAKIQTTTNKKKLTKIEKELPGLIEEYKNNEKTLTEELAIYKNKESELKSLEYTLTGLMEKESQLKNEIVSENDIHLLNQEIATTTLKLEELEIKEKSVYERNYEIQNTIQQLEDCNSKLEQSKALLSELNFDMDNKFKKMFLEYETEKKLYNENMKSIKNLEMIEDSYEKTSAEQLKQIDNELESCKGELKQIKR